MNENILESAENKMMLSLDNLDKRFATVRAGRANPNVLDGIMVEYYGNMTPLKQLAMISIPEARQLLIKPFDKTCLSGIEKAIQSSNLGLVPNNDGETIRIIIPALTEERRKELSKQVKALAEEAKVAIRNIRQDAMKEIDKTITAEDEKKAKEKEVQNLTDEYNKQVDSKLKEKEEELMTV